MCGGGEKTAWLPEQLRVSSSTQLPRNRERPEGEVGGRKEAAVSASSGVICLFSK